MSGPTPAPPVPDSPLLSVVYPTRDRPEMLLRSLRALLANSELPDEIVVVDQSKDDRTREALAALGEARIVHVPSREKGLSNSRNSGIGRSRHPILGFIDDDCIPARDWVRAAKDAIRQEPSSAVWIGQDYESAAADSEAVVAGHPERTFSVTGVHDPWSVGPTGGNSFFRRSTFAAVGLFDPDLGQGSDFPGAEDGDMIYRVLKHGLRVTYSNRIRVHHVTWRSDDETAGNSYNYGKGVGAMLAKYQLQGDYYPLLRIFTRRWLNKFFAVPIFLVTGRRRRYRDALGWSRGIAHGFSGWRRRQRALVGGGAP